MVTRETGLEKGLVALGIQAAPRAVEQLLGLREALGGEAVRLGFLGPAESEKLVPRHLLESAALLPFLDEDGPWIDVGSGAGLPGLVLAILGHRPVTLLDSDRRRARFCERTAQALELDVVVAWGRAEELARDPEHREGYGTAIARALAPPRVSLEYLLPLVRVGGRALVSTGPGIWDDLEGAAEAGRLLGGRRPELVRVEVPGLDAERWAMIVEKEDACPDRYPRRVGVPARRPLGGG